jgi:hypothetical protein
MIKEYHARRRKWKTPPAAFGAAFAKGGVNIWALDLQTLGTLWLQAGCGWGIGYGVVVEAIVGTTLVGTIGGPAFSNCFG